MGKNSHSPTWWWWSPVFMAPWPHVIVPSPDVFGEAGWASWTLATWSAHEWSQKRGSWKCWFVRYTLQGINISHLRKRKIIFKMPFFGGYVSSLEGIWFPEKLTVWGPQTWWGLEGTRLRNGLKYDHLQLMNSLDFWGYSISWNLCFDVSLRRTCRRNTWSKDKTAFSLSQEHMFSSMCANQTVRCIQD